MKRNMDLIRKILMRIEEHPHFPEIGSEIPEVTMDILGHNDEEINYHLILLSQAGLVFASNRGDYGYRWVHGLTWQGHEFLELMSPLKKLKLFNMIGMTLHIMVKNASFYGTKPL